MLHPVSSWDAGNARPVRLQRRLQMPRGRIVSVLRDVNGAQLLPHVRDEHAVTTRWQAQQLLSADLRTVAPPWAELAQQVTIWP